MSEGRGCALVIGEGCLYKEMLAKVSAQEGFTITRAADCSRALELAHGSRFDVVLVDASSPGSMAVETLHGLKQVDPDLSVIVLESSSSPDGLADDAYCCLHEPLEFGTFSRTVRQAIERSQLILEKNRLARQLQSERAKQERSSSPDSEPPHVSLVGASLAISEVRRLIAEVAPTDITVLVEGESGTGKEIVASLIHRASPRTGTGNLVKINCPAVPELLLESELFGYEAGAFTGAQERKLGRLEFAAGGSAFLDEIGEIPPVIQAKLLQVLEHKQFLRLGGNRMIGIDARFLAATNRPLEHLVATGRFRTDLYFRLNQYVISIPPLRDRVEDIPLLVDHFLKKYGPMYGREHLRVCKDTMALLLQSPWPGNVRELESVMRRYALTGREDSIESSLTKHPSGTSSASPQGTYHQCEKNTIMAALWEAGWNRRQAAAVLGISYNTLRRRIAQYEIKCTCAVPAARGV